MFSTMFPSFCSPTFTNGFNPFCTPTFNGANGFCGPVNTPWTNTFSNPWTNFNGVNPSNCFTPSNTFPNWFNTFNTPTPINTPGCWVNPFTGQTISAFNSFGTPNFFTNNPANFTGFPTPTSNWTPNFNTPGFNTPGFNPFTNVTNWFNPGFSPVNAFPTPFAWNAFGVNPWTAAFFGFNPNTNVADNECANTAGSINNARHRQAA